MGKYVIDCYEFTYEALVSLDIMKDGVIKEKRTVYIPGTNFDSAWEIANMIMKNAESSYMNVKAVSMVPVKRSREFI